MKKIGLLHTILIIHCLIFIVKAQTIEIDSLRNILKTTISRDTVGVNLLIKEANQILNITPTKALICAEEALELSEKINFIEGKAKSLMLIGNYHNEKSDYFEALIYYQRALNIIQNLGDKKQMAICLIKIGIIYRDQGDFLKAFENCQKGLIIGEEIGDKLIIARCLKHIGVIYYYQGNYEQAIDYCKDALEISKEIDNKIEIARNLNNLGGIYWKQGNYKEALVYSQNSLKLKEEYGDRESISVTLNTIGEIYFSQGKYLKSLDYFQKALSIREKLENKYRICYSYRLIGAVYLKINNLPKALEYTNKSLEIAIEEKLLYDQKDIYDQLSIIYAKNKNFEKAYENNIVFNKLNDSIFNVNKLKIITSLEKQYEYDKERQAAELEQQKKDAIQAEKSKRQNVISIAFIIGFILMTSLVLVILKSFIQKRKANFLLAKKNLQIEGKNKTLLKQKDGFQIFATELEKANKTKDKFFSIIAHDLKSPFSALMGFSDLLLESHNEIDSKEREEYIRHIKDGSIKTFKLLENLLTWAQSQTGKINYTPVEINTEELITEIIELLEEPANNKDIKLISNAEKELLLQADKNMLHTVIRNLVSNAIKFTPKGGEIVVKTQTIVFENDQKIVEISVKDSGVGIPPEIRDKLFKITENVTTKGTENESGTGLGLILCQEFVERHGGKIWVESEVGNGSEFLFTIPFLN